MRVSLRFEIFKRDAFTCRYCGKRSPEAILEVDHVVPRSAGGSDEPENLVTSCYECNRGKSARLLTDIPREENLHEKAILIAEQELQIQELEHWRNKQRQREDKDLKSLFKLWRSRFENGWWQETRVRGYLRKLGYFDVLEAIEYAMDHAKKWPGRSFNESAWILFCAICSKHVKNAGGIDDAE